MKHTLQIKTAITLAFCLLSFIAAPVFAADLFFEQDKTPVNQDQFKMNVFLGAEEPVNAVEGEISFPAGPLSLQSVEDGNSIVNFWIDRPVVDTTGEIKFSGITPGGYKGERGLIFSMTFLVKQEGTGTFSINNARALLNDGNGTEAKLQIFDAPFIISKKTVNIQVPAAEIKDNTPPEAFAPELAHSPDVFGDQRFIVFATQDKGSGIDHYEIKESRQRILSLFEKWITAESPYILRDQELRSYVFVRAVDKAGNVQVEKIIPQNPLRWYKNYENWFIIILGFVIAYVIKKFLWRRHLRK